MSLIRPFRGLRPDAAHAAAVIAPPYDVLSSAEAREAVAGRPFSFLRISKAEVELPVDINATDEAVFRQAARNWARWRREVLIQDPTPCYYCYELTMGDHTQKGLVAAASVEAYAEGRIRRHELTRPDKERDRVRHIEALNAQTGPAFLTFRAQPDIAALLARASEGQAAIDAVLNGVRHRLWVVADQDLIDRLTAAFERLPRVYIADGHHRTAAARIVAGSRGPQPGPHHAFLSVLFPDNEMQILNYDRVVADLHGLTVPGLLEALAALCEVRPEEAAVRPAGPAEFGMYLAGHWYRLRFRGARPKDAVARLDVSLLQDQVLAPLLGITDPRRDQRIEFVGGIRGPQALAARVDRVGGVAFTLYPTGLADLMEVADHDAVMPPKSTWFEPKLADGLVSYSLEDG
ncbi:DUF1015 family protein [Acidiferrobacter sp.]|uniref:DUF1015 domain-containing protein n=1 Tax=Acidiferrobacter sp. TaxID=1872107 RepID=UPI0026192F23|nr:DUF1015 family protein [Acidiferrobacter sp.]